MYLNIDTGTFNISSSFEVSENSSISEIISKNYLKFITRLDYSNNIFHRLIIKEIPDSNICFNLAIYSFNNDDKVNRIEIYLGEEKYQSYNDAIVKEGKDVLDNLCIQICGATSREFKWGKIASIFDLKVGVNYIFIMYE